MGTDTGKSMDSKVKTDEKDMEIDDAVLRMAMAMADEEEAVDPTAVVEEEKKKEGLFGSGIEFDINILIQGFWLCVIVWVYGGLFLGVVQGRIQDRTGGDLTLYDFFDNVFSFKEWDLEYSLGFNPYTAFADLKAKAGL